MGVSGILWSIKWVVDQIVSWEPEGRYCSSKMFRWEPEGGHHCTKSMSIAPFWFSTEHRWTPFWLSTDEMGEDHVAINPCEHMGRTVAPANFGLHTFALWCNPVWLLWRSTKEICVCELLWRCDFYRVYSSQSQAMIAVAYYTCTVLSIVIYQRNRALDHRNFSVLFDKIVIQLL